MKKVFLIFMLYYCQNQTSQAQQQDFNWWKRLSETDSVVSSYISEIYKGDIGIPMMSVTEKGDSTFISLSAIATVNAFRVHPPDFILIHPKGKIVGYHGLVKRTQIKTYTFDQLKEFIGKRLCDDSQSVEEGMQIPCTFNYDPLALRIMIYDGKFLYTDYLKANFPF